MFSAYVNTLPNLFGLFLVIFGHLGLFKVMLFGTQFVSDMGVTIDILLRLTSIITLNLVYALENFPLLLTFRKTETATEMCFQMLEHKLC